MLSPPGPSYTILILFSCDTHDLLLDTLRILVTFELNRLFQPSPQYSQTLPGIPYPIEQCVGRLTVCVLQQIIDRTRKTHPAVRIVIVGMMVPPNLGPDYSNGFRNLFVELAEENQAELIPFLLEGVAGKPELNLSDGIHPTAEGHRIIADTVWETLLPLLSDR